MDRPLSSFFEKFLFLYKENKDRKRLFIASASKEGVSLSEGELSIDGVIITINAPAAKKNELFLKKERILEHFNAEAEKPLIAIR